MPNINRNIIHIIHYNYLKKNCQNYNLVLNDGKGDDVL